MFKVPESARITFENIPRPEAVRLVTRPHAGKFGAFYIPGPCGAPLLAIASDGPAWIADGMPGLPWEHVSVSTTRRCPNWEEMCFVKNLFWDAEDCVLQFHPPKSDWVNLHQFCLHLWRPLGVEVPRPPFIAVGPKR